MRKNLGKQDHFTTEDPDTLRGSRSGFTFPFLFLQCPPPDLAGAGAGEGVGEFHQARYFFRVWRDSKADEEFDFKVNSR